VFLLCSCVCACVRVGLLLRIFSFSIVTDFVVFNKASSQEGYLAAALSFPHATAPQQPTTYGTTPYFPTGRQVLVPGTPHTVHTYEQTRN
jgi:hypothetical protein